MFFTNFYEKFNLPRLILGLKQNKNRDKKSAVGRPTTPQCLKVKKKPV